MENVVQAMCLWVKNRIDLVLAQKMMIETDGVLTQAKVGRYTDNNEDMDDNFLLFMKYTF